MLRGGVGEVDPNLPVGSRGVRDAREDWVGVEDRAGVVVPVFVEVEEGVMGWERTGVGDSLEDPVAGYVTRALPVATEALGVPEPPPPPTPQGVPVMGEEEAVLLERGEAVDEDVLLPVDVFEEEREAVAVVVGMALASACRRSRFTCRSPMRARAAYSSPPPRRVRVVSKRGGESVVRLTREPAFKSSPGGT